jgi:hypothetical protein
MQVPKVMPRNLKIVSAVVAAVGTEVEVKIVEMTIVSAHRRHSEGSLAQVLKLRATDSRS